MPDILLTRIDNRLVHGQVGVAWTSSLAGCNLIVVADDLVAKDEVQQSLMRATAQNAGCGIRFFTKLHPPSTSSWSCATRRVPELSSRGACRSTNSASETCTSDREREYPTKPMSMWMTRILKICASSAAGAQTFTSRLLRVTGSMTSKSNQKHLLQKRKENQKCKLRLCRAY